MIPASRRRLTLQTADFKWKIMTVLISSLSVRNIDQTRFNFEKLSVCFVVLTRTFMAAEHACY